MSLDILMGMGIISAIWVICILAARLGERQGKRDSEKYFAEADRLHRNIMALLEHQKNTREAANK